MDDKHQRDRHAHRWWQLCGVICLPLLLLTACDLFPPSVSHEVSADDGMLFSDDFSRDIGAWACFDTPESAAYVRDGEFYLEDRGEGVAVYAPLVGRVYDRIALRTQVRHVQGTVNNWMGVLCRQQDEQNYYLFAISADGFYLLLRVHDGEATPLAGPQSSDVIHIGRSANALEVHCQGNLLSLTVNGTLLVTRTDDVLAASGGVALFADAVAPGQTATVAFDHVDITLP